MNKEQVIFVNILLTQNYYAVKMQHVDMNYLPCPYRLSSFYSYYKWNKNKKCFLSSSNIEFFTRSFMNVWRAKGVDTRTLIRFDNSCITSLTFLVTQFSCHFYNDDVVANKIRTCFIVTLHATLWMFAFFILRHFISYIFHLKCIPLV